MGDKMNNIENLVMPYNTDNFNVIKVEVNDDLKDVIKVEPIFSFGQFVDLDYEKFIQFSVGTNNIDDSNNFLKSMWRELDLEVSYDDKERCAWFYSPNKIRIGNKNISYFGIMDTKIGRIYVAVSYKRKGTIDNIMFFMTELGFEEKYKPLFKRLVRQAKTNITKVYLYEVTLSVQGKFLNEQGKFPIYDYVYENFRIYNENDTCKMKFKVSAYDFVDAKRVAYEKINRILNFISVETNIYYEYKDIEVNRTDDCIKYEYDEDKYIYQDNIQLPDGKIEQGKFIELCPLYENRILLSKKGVKLIGKIIDGDNKNIMKSFLEACYHFKQGLEREYQLEERIINISAQQVFSIAPIDIQNKQNILDIAVTFYLSAIETVTLWDNKPDKCEACSQLKHQISNRVAKFMNTYLFPDEGGQLFKKIYELRSRYLHAGESVSSYSIGKNYPLLDERTGSGCVDQGFITLSIKGEVSIIYITDIRELVSYSLREYYRNELTEV